MSQKADILLAMFTETKVVSMVTTLLDHISHCLEKFCLEYTCVIIKLQHMYHDFTIILLIVDCLVL